jgi:hypothetical protein
MVKRYLVRRLLSILAISLALAGAAVAIPATAAQAAPALPTWNTEIMNYRSKKCLDQSWSGGIQRPTVGVWACLTQSNQRWKLVPVGSPTNNYMIRNERSGKCLNQDFSGGVRHSNVIAYTCDTSMANGIWRVLYQGPYGGEEVYSFFNVRTGDILDQNWSGGTEHSEALAWPYPGYTATNQLWYFHLE